ncbi:MAG TPA: ABC transporter permease [Thermaerobacter sp.]
MMAYLLRRLVHGCLVVLGVITLVFVVMRLAGDPTPLFLPVGATPEDIARVRHELGLDRPLLEQYLQFLGQALRGDFGQSLRYHQPALALVLERLPATLGVAGVALGLCLVVGVPLGVLAAVRRDSVWDLIASVLALFGQSMPTFWLATVLILGFALYWRLFPTSGGEGWQSWILPGVTLAAYSLALITRTVRSAMLEVLRQDFVRTARAKGLAERLVLFRHALRAAAIPVVTVTGLQASPLLGGAVVTEQVFGFPGMGQLAVQAVIARDFPVVQAFVMVSAVLVVLVNILVDIVYVLLDPRVSYD